MPPPNLPVTEILPDCSQRSPPQRGAGRAARRRQDDAGAAGAARCSRGSAAARSCCSNRAGSPRAPPRAAWPSFSARSRAERSATRCAWKAAMSAKTRIMVVTEGVLARMILDDPELPGVSAVLFDEFHERSLDGDFGLALALDVQGRAAAGPAASRHVGDARRRARGEPARRRAGHRERGPQLSGRDPP